MDYIVEYYEKQTDWGGDIWYCRFPSKQAADEAIKECNDALPTDGIVPEHYIKASYVGVDNFNNPKYDQVYSYTEE